MKFKILIAVLLLGHHYCSLGARSQPVQGSLSKVGRPFTAADLEDWMNHQNYKADFKGLSLQAQSLKVRSMVLANDFELNKNSGVYGTAQRRGLAENQSTAIVEPNISNQNPAVDDALIRTLEVVQAQKRLLLVQFYEVIKEVQGQEDVADPAIAKLLTNYLQHLSYIYEKEGRENESIPPVVYNYHINQVIAPYCDSPQLELPPEEFLNEKDDPLIDAFDRYNVEHMQTARKTLQLVRGGLKKGKGAGRKLFFGLFGRRQQSSASQGQGANIPVKEKPKQTEIYTGSVYDLAIEDHVDEYNKQWTFDYEAIRNLQSMTEILAREYEEIFRPVQQLNDRLRGAVYAEDARLTIEDYDEVKEMAKSIISSDNRHRAIMNQIIVNFNNRDPNLDTFLAIHRHPPMMANMARLRSEAASDQAATSGKTFEDKKFGVLVQQLRESYFNIVSQAKQCENVFDNFGYQTQLIRTSADSFTYNSRTKAAALASLRKLIPIIARFASTFVSNLQQLSRELHTMDRYEAQLFDAAVELEHKLDMAGYHIKQSRNKSWFQRLTGGRKAKSTDSKKSSDIKV